MNPRRRRHQRLRRHARKWTGWMQFPNGARIYFIGTPSGRRGEYLIGADFAYGDWGAVLGR